MDKKLIFSGKMNEEDFKKLFIYQTGFKLIFIVPIYIVIFSGLLYLLKLYTAFDLSILLILVISALSSIIFVFIYVLFLYNRLKNDFKKDLEKIKEQRYVVEDDRISILVEKRKTDLYFKDIKNIKNTKDFYIIYHKSTLVLAIPKRFIDKSIINQVNEKLNFK